MVQKIREAEDVLRAIPKPGESILPVPGEENILITSALPYCNNVPHLGNIIGSTLSADVFARYSRTRNRKTLYVCGTDEYGTATETQALKEGLTPRALCDKYNAIHVETYKWFELSFDIFSRTSTQKHTEICQEIYLNLAKNNFLERAEKEQTYCEGCSKFLADRFVEGTCPHCGADDARGDQCDVCGRTLDAIELINPRCLVDKTHKVTTRTTAHMYVRLNELQPRTEEWIRKSWKKGHWSPNAVINGDGELVDARLKGGLRPSPVTRDLTWGVPVPHVDGKEHEGMESKVFYVWFDACIGYPSITANYTSEWKRWWFDNKNVNLYQFMGKDNVYFHVIYFPSIQLGDGRPWTMLHHLSTTEFLNYEGGKFSKSHNRGVFGPAARETGIPPSVWRYYLISTRPETADAMFSWADCIAANNNVLLNNFGNFVNRALKFVASQYESTIPDSGDEPGPYSPNDENDAEFITEINALVKEYVDNMDAVKLRSGLHTVMTISARGNLYLQSSGLNKQLMTENPKRCAQVVSRALNLIYLLTALVHPFMPSTEAAILAQLNAPPRAVSTVLSNDLLAGHTIGTPEHLFKRIDEKMADVWRDKFGGNKPQEPSPLAEAADATHVVPGMSKRKAAAAKKAADKAAAAEATANAPPKSSEVLAWEQKIAQQGQVVRELKAKPKSEENDKEVAAAVDELKRLKAELAELSQKAQTPEA
ncbi:methionyl-tRNA synthetase [Dichomitus squalens]|uniref:methionine--tRNA ligase n=1 Tax=Dichomitus squalens TaxID=114155 RepID=A0A4Q9P7C9_9APHY|nr:methionyl-tRNA synthetase [Dichomitus squalens LYAD-421 SS1]EJF64745.1 methionyl-tRNA synthetase [Dichomitus squalens LYAD-421 SS1]TBU50414.1 methionyl-tRNA synthetase [Dichomitus squalens]TBU62950.1 methionyl-tRNA synthetase [Dichomitus squalens]